MTGSRKQFLTINLVKLNYRHLFLYFCDRRLYNTNSKEKNTELKELILSC